jgi:hypothetical protein
MTQRATVLAVVCALYALRSEAAEADALPPREAKGLNLLLSGTVVPEEDGTRFGFLLGGGFEFPATSFIDLNVGMSFQRIGSAAGPVTVVDLIEATVSKRAQTAIFFGAGIGPLIALGNVRAGAKMFGGVELFHQSALPIQIGLELIQKFCDEGQWLKCPDGERQTWLAGRIGLRY